MDLSAFNRRWTLAPAILACSFALACSDRDVGNPCTPRDLADEDVASTDGTRLETDEIVDFDVSHPCDELICIATDGRSGYCSKKCRENVGCPPGFECRVIFESTNSTANIDVAGQGFCTWMPCERHSDCGDKDEFCCVAEPTPEGGEPRKLCAFKEDERCP